MSIDSPLSLESHDAVAINTTSHTASNAVVFGDNILARNVRSFIVNGNPVGSKGERHICRFDERTHSAPGQMAPARFARTKLIGAEAAG